MTTAQEERVETKVISLQAMLVVRGDSDHGELAEIHLIAKKGTPDETALKELFQGPLRFHLTTLCQGVFGDNKRQLWLKLTHVEKNEEKKKLKK